MGIEPTPSKEFLLTGTGPLWMCTLHHYLRLTTYILRIKQNKTAGHLHCSNICKMSHAYSIKHPHTIVDHFAGTSKPIPLNPNPRLHHILQKLFLAPDGYNNIHHTTKPFSRATTPPPPFRLKGPNLLYI